MDNSDRIDDSGIVALRSAYDSLLKARNAMLDALSRLLEDSPSRREVIVDSLILGILHHLHEVANNPEIYAKEISEFGPDFLTYADHLVSDVTLLIRNLSPGNPSPSPAERVRSSRA